MPRSKPSRNGGSSDQPTYAIFNAESLAASQIGEGKGRTAEQALREFIKSNPSSDTSSVAIVPTRNIKRATTETEQVVKTKISLG